MRQLSRETIQDLEGVKIKRFPERVIQFGEGNFLRGFVDWMIHKANQEGVYNGSVVVAQPIKNGLVPVLNEQDGLYTLLLRGIVNDEEVVEEELVSSISRGIESYTNWEQVLECAENPDIDVMVSNTTEAGISYSGEDSYTDTPPDSFPGKVTVYLYRRFKKFDGDFDKGMLIVPCELIEQNGDNLKAIVLRLADEWQLGSDFIEWVKNANIFANTLVDRIVTGYPGKEQADKLAQAYGYEDKLLNTGEYFHLWVIEAPQEAANMFPVHKASGLDVKWVDDMTPYRTRKVRILNGAHTTTFAAAYLAGFDFVKSTVDHELLGKYLENIIFSEIIPTVDMDKDELKEFAGQVIERFKNPYIKHRWLDISLNAVSKYKARVLPSLLPYLKQGEMPTFLSFSLAALISFYRGTKLTEEGLVGKRGDEEYLIRDNKDVLEFFADLWTSFDGDYSVIANKVLSEKRFWDEDLSLYQGLENQLAEYLANIAENGMFAAIEEIVEMEETEWSAS